MFAITLERDRSFAVGYLLVGVVLLIAVLVAQPGMYWGLFHVKAIIATDETFAAITVHAETEPTWRWAGWRRPAYKYHLAEMKVLTDGDRSVHLDLMKDTWTSAGSSGNLDAENLAQLIVRSSQAETADPELGPKVTAVLDLLHDMRDGNAPPPRHHGSGMKTPIDASITHFALGGNYGIFAIIGWLALWPVYLCLPRSRPAVRWLTPRKAFLIAAGGAISLDLAFAGITYAFSPGGISEAMEFLIGMVNLPVFAFTGGSCVDLFPVGWAVSAAVWGAVLSVCVTLERPRRKTIPVKPK